MSLGFILLSVRKPGDEDVSNERMNEELNQISIIENCIINNLGGDINEIQFLKHDKNEIKRQLIFVSTHYNSSIILIIGDTMSNVVYAAIKEVSDNNICSEINASIIDLTQRLKHLTDRPICGIRNKCFIINMCGPYINAEEGLNGNGTLILETLFLINKLDEKICDVQKSDSPVESLNDNNNDNNSDETYHSNSNDHKSDELFHNDSNDDNFDESFYNDDKSDKSLKNNSNDDIHHSDKLFIDLSFEKRMKNVLTDKDIYKKQKGNEMVSFEKAKDIMKEVITKDYEECTEIVQTNDARGRIVAKDVHSSVNVPPCCISAKHGYAMLASDGQGVIKVLRANLVLVQEIVVVPGTCVRVRSGDPIPNGATAVVMSANTKIIEEQDNSDDYFNIDNKEYEIEVLVAPKEGENIRNAGCEILSNEIVIDSHHRVETADLGILTLCDIDSITVFKLPSVGLLSIGYELLEPGNISTLGRIYECNKIIVSSLLKSKGYDPVDFGISAYEPNVMQYKIKDALEKVDLLVIIGRTNDKDILKPLLKATFNANIHFGRVNIKPGKSTTFATCKFHQKRKYFLCMSANPATVPIITHILLRPLLNILCCNKDDDPLKIQTGIKTPHELHLRPSFSWTSLQWSEKEADIYPSAHCMTVEHQNMMKYQFSNALLMLPMYTPEVPKLNANSAFLTAMFTDD